MVGEGPGPVPVPPVNPNNEILIVKIRDYAGRVHRKQRGGTKLVGSRGAPSDVPMGPQTRDSLGGLSRHRVGRNET